jgi:hypothetical protein
MPKRRAFEEWVAEHKSADARFREQTGDMIREVIDEWAAETAGQKERMMYREQKILNKQMKAKRRREKKEGAEDAEQTGMQIFVKILYSEKAILLDVEASDTVASVKTLIRAALRVRRPLVWEVLARPHTERCADELPDDRTLSDCSIIDLDTVHYNFFQTAMKAVQAGKFANKVAAAAKAKA